MAGAGDLPQEHPAAMLAEGLRDLPQHAPGQRALGERPVDDDHRDVQQLRIVHLVRRQRVRRAEQQVAPAGQRHDVALAKHEPGRLPVEDLLAAADALDEQPLALE
jgi:hypothetical protein